MEKRDPSCTVCGNVNCYSHYGRQYGDSLKKKNNYSFRIKLPYDPATPLLGVYAEEIKIEKDTCSPMFIAGLFTIVRTWKQPRCPSADEWIKKLRSIYTQWNISH